MITIRHSRRARRAGFVSAVLLGSLFVLSACGGGTESGGDGGGSKGTIAFSHPNSAAPVTKTIQGYAKQQAEKLGYKLLVDNANNDLDTQVADINTWIAQGVDAIVVFPLDPKALEPSRERAQKAGIKWLSYASREDDTDGAVVFPHDESAKLLADDAVAWIKKQKSAPEALILTATNLPSISDRWTVLQDALAGTDAKIVANQDAIDQETGLRVTESVLSSHPNLRMVLGTNDDGALGALQAFKRAGIPEDEVYIGGNDGTLEAFEAVKAGGAYRASVSIDVKRVGFGVADAAANAIEGKGVAAFVEVPPKLGTLSDSATLEALIADLK